MLDDLFKTLIRMGIEPIGSENARQSVYVETREVTIPYDLATISVMENEKEAMPQIFISM